MLCTLVSFNGIHFETDSPASGRGQEKYMKHTAFPLPLLEAGLSVFNITFWFKIVTFENELTKKETVINAKIGFIKLSVFKKTC